MTRRKPPAAGGNVVQFPRPLRRIPVQDIQIGPPSLPGTAPVTKLQQEEPATSSWRPDLSTQMVFERAEAMATRPVSKECKACAMMCAWRRLRGLDGHY